MHVLNSLNSEAPQLNQLIPFLITDRFNFYNTTRDYFRLLCWQVLDAEIESSNTGNTQMITDCCQLIKKMQQNNVIRSDVDAEVLVVALMGSVYAPFMLEKILPLSDTQKQQYIHLMEDGFYKLMYP